MPGRVLLAGGPGLDEAGMEELELWAQEEEEGSGISSEEEGGPGPPP